MASFEKTHYIAILTQFHQNSLIAQVNYKILVNFEPAYWAFILALRPSAQTNKRSSCWLCIFPLSFTDVLIRDANRALKQDYDKDLARLNFLSYLELYFPAFFDETYNATLVFNGGQNLVKTSLVLRAPFQNPENYEDERIPRLERTDQISDNGENGFLCNVEDVIHMISKEDGKWCVDLARKNGIPLTIW